ncbi:MAG: putative membrane protein [Marinobacter excellens HL-55]|uniref:Putative membrane protein n=1 Tax=Marinobacter excellens HL-55 TaxID=1305731 RepID=A0A0P7YHR5_9GAMM|nr:MAG: putative membrane protein [Marinobacter excellens HL-55]
MSALKDFVHNHGAKGDQSLLKTITFAITHFIVAFSVAYLLTGDILIGSLIAMVEPAINTVAYFFHEKIWARHQQNTTVEGPSLRHNTAPGC